MRALVATVLVVSILIADHQAPYSVRVPVDASTLSIYMGVFLLSTLRRIKNVEDRAERIAFHWACVPAVTGVVLWTADGILVFIPGWSAGLRVAGSALVLLSMVTFVLVTRAVSAAGLFGWATATVMSVLLLLALFLYPTLIVVLMTNGQWPTPLFGPSQVNAAVDLICLIPPAVLFVAPEVLRKLLPWEDAKSATQRLLPGWLAGIALVFTCGYAIALHFAPGNPVAATR